MRELLAIAPGVIPPSSTLQRLSDAWGNEGFAAKSDFLEEVARQAAATEGPILECGTGVTTLVLAAVAERRGITLCCLEHDPEWARRVSRRLAAAGLAPNPVVVAPLVSFNGYSWYLTPESGFPSSFRLIICDGPPGDTRGGRYGLLPKMKSRFAAKAIILLDDVMRGSEQGVLRRWQAEGCSAPVLSPSQTFARVAYGTEAVTS